MYSKLFIFTLFAALTSLVAATSTNDGLVIKREALQARMHQRAAAGHGALKKRQATDVENAGKQRIQRAQYHPTRTAVAAPGMEKRQFLGASYPCTGVLFGVNQPIGCTPSTANAPKPSVVACTGTNYNGCNPGETIGVSGGVSYSSSAAGISSCCQTGYACQKLGPFQASYCLNLPFGDLFNLNEAIAARSFATQQEFADFLAGRKSVTG